MSAAALAAANRRIALVGSPNSGKTTLFNALTGHRAKTGNYPGVTVDRREGRLRPGDESVALIDLPGTYSLHAISEDEAVVVRALCGDIEGEPKPDAVLIVADVTTLPRSLPMIAEVLALGLPACLVVTMIDELKARGGDLDLFRLQKELGIPIVGVVGNKGLGIDDLRERIEAADTWPIAESVPAGGAEVRFAWADKVIEAAQRARPAASKLTARLDSVLLHPIGGLLVFAVFMAAFFQSIFSWATPAMDFLSGAMDGLADTLIETLPAAWWSSLLANGIVRGVGAVVVFVPQIALLFAVIFFFEACGYLARAAFVIDRVMGWAGLEGRCFVALLSSYACAVPGVMAARTIPGPRHRLATILAAPLMTCSARLPVYALLISTFVSPERVFGPFTKQGLTLMGLYLVGSLGAVIYAGVIKRGLLRGAALPFYLELPPYRFPSLATVTVQVWRRLWMFLKRAGTVILIASVVLWALLSFPGAPEDVSTDTLQSRQAAIEHSYGAQLGKAIEPILTPLGWDWRIGVGLIGAQAAREVMISTMAQVYAIDADDEDTAPLAATLTAIDPATGKPRLSEASAWALMVFFVFALQCISTLVVMRRETGGWRWPAFAFVSMNTLAWVAAWVTFRLAGGA